MPASRWSIARWWSTGIASPAASRTTWKRFREKPSTCSAVAPRRTRHKRKEAALTRYVLPDLSYDYGALEPHLSGKIMQLHHDKHHRAYVEGANKAIEGLLEARRQMNFTHIAQLE